MRFLSLVLLAVLSFSFQVIAQSTSDFSRSIQAFDLSPLWKSDSIRLGEGPAYMPQPEPIGIIGTDFQRFYIHFLSVSPVAGSKGQYRVTGKTRVKTSVCNFTGTITIKEAKLYKAEETDFPQYKQGFITSEIVFYEDSSQSSSGLIKGTMISFFYLDNNVLKYDALKFDADQAGNNLCTGTWTSYKTGKSKKCNWGDWRIPDSEGLDIGASEFMPAEKYYSKGWGTYAKAWFTSPDKTDDPEVNKAREVEFSKWWE